ncbi:MAG: hypothetical protein H9802_10345, partial [Candidatus Phocaeicola faecipullorum]|nr:hypothetical protein [Candidatus Phocaeicola faecipullorum]
MLGISNFPQPKANPAPVFIQPEDDSFKKVPHRSNLFFVIIALIAFLLSGILVSMDAVALRLEDGRVAAFPALPVGGTFYLREERTTLRHTEKGYEAY